MMKGKLAGGAGYPEFGAADGWRRLHQKKLPPLLMLGAFIATFFIKIHIAIFLRLAARSARWTVY
jgi:hypothetical protein